MQRLILHLSPQPLQSPSALLPASGQHNSGYQGVRSFAHAASYYRPQPTPPDGAGVRIAYFTGGTPSCRQMRRTR